MLRSRLASAYLAFRPLFTSVRQRGRLLFSDRCLLYTNIGLSIGLSVAGDFLQQNYQQQKYHLNKKWDEERTWKMAASGLVIGPFMHYWYIYLDKWFPGRCWRVLTKKLVIDQLVFSPLYVTTFLVTIGLLEKQGWEAMKEEFKEAGVMMYITEFVVWTPAQALNFYYLPTRYRVLFDSIVALAVDTFFSYLRFDHHASKEIKQDVQNNEMIPLLTTKSNLRQEMKTKMNKQG